MTRWWPALGVLGTIALGLAVGTGSTALDDQFLRDAHGIFGADPSWMLFLSSWWLLGPLLAAAVVIALLINEGSKHIFGRRNGPYLEYPSGHTTLMIAVLASVVLIVGVRAWTVALAVITAMLGMIGLVACGFHYFTATIGAVLLTTAEFSMAVRVLQRPGLATH